MKKVIPILRFAVIIMLSSFMFSSCVDKEYDDLETANVDPDLTPTHTIAQLQALVTGPAILITTDVIIAGVVTGDDFTGNIYKKLILQQDSSGVAIQLDISNFNTQYPTGRRIYVKCNGLYLQNNGGNFELGTSPGSTMGRIPAGMAPKYLVKGMWGQYITPKVYTFDNPNIPTNTLVQFNNVQFDNGFNGIAYAAASPANLDLIDCNDVTFILYSSTYSTFALAKTPTGNGSIVGIYTIFNGDGELQIRDTTDVNMTGIRCDGSTGIATLTTIDSLRALYQGSPVTIKDRKIVATVITDYSTNMLGTNSRNVYVQEDTTGIQIRFDDPHTFPVGSKLEINVSEGEVSTFNSVIQVTNIPLGAVTVIGSGAISPRTTSIADILANYATREATLVTIPNVTITGTGTYNGAIGINTLTDATGSMDLYTGSSATFKSIAYPTGTVSVTGLVTQYNGLYEIMIRDTTDVQ